jgi:hypothetical protein
MRGKVRASLWSLSGRQTCGKVSLACAEGVGIAPGFETKIQLIVEPALLIIGPLPKKLAGPAMTILNGDMYYHSHRPTPCDWWT